jgi:hypothetical protein
MKRRGSLSLLGEAVIVELQNEARYERAMNRFVDDDLPAPPEIDYLASAQSRRAAKDF